MIIGREGEREREGDRQTDRQTGRQTDTETDTQRQTDRHRDRHRDRHTERDMRPAVSIQMMSPLKQIDIPVTTRSLLESKFRGGGGGGGGGGGDCKWLFASLRHLC